MIAPVASTAASRRSDLRSMRVREAGKIAGLFVLIAYAVYACAMAIFSLFYTLYGAVLVKLGEDLPAYEALRHAHDLNPQEPETEDLLYGVTRGLAQRSQTEKQYPGSLRYFQEAAKLRPTDPEPHLRMAEIYRLTGRKAQATAEQQQADELTRNSSTTNRSH